MLGRTYTSWLTLLMTAFAFVGCADTGGPATHANDDDEFESAGSAGSNGATADAGLSAAPSDDEAADDRTVEEADLYRFVDNRLYVLNQYRGLFVFDVTDPDHPREIGRMPLVGYPVEMYVRGTRAYAIISDYFDYWRDGAALDAGLVPTFGSRIVGIDLSDPSAPHEIGDVVLNGYISDTRLVGDILYSVSNRYAYWGGYGVAESETRDEMVLTSIDISDPAHIREVQHLNFEGSGYYVHATSNAFVIASVRNDSPDGWSRTHVRYVDISSPVGLLVARGDVALDGYMQDDTALDVHGSQVRVLTRSWDDQTTKLRILNAALPDTLPLVGELDYYYEGNVYGTAFDGDRLYMVHFQQIDPLEVVDLSDPTHPFVAGELEIPGWVERIAPMGDRLIGLGVDNTESRTVTVSLFDVSNPAVPTMLDRVTSGSGSWAWSAASYERKAWTVDAENGIILFPYSSYDYTSYASHNALGILEFDRSHLAVRGEVEADAPVDRGAVFQNRVYALSQSALQVVDIRDRAHPTPTATVELARSISGYARTASAGVELVQPGISYGWWGGGEGASMLRISPLNAPDGNEEYSRITLPRSAQAVITHGSTAIALRTSAGCYYYDGACASDAREGAVFVSLADATAPAVLADVDLPVETITLPTSFPDGGYASAYTYFQTRYNAPYGGWQGGESALALGDGRFALVRTTTINCSGLETCRSVGIEPTRSPYYSYDGSGREPYYYYYGSSYRNALVILDARSNSVSDAIDLGAGTIENLFVNDGVLVYSHALPSRVDADGRSWVRYYMERFALSESPTHIDSINVPGVVISLATDGSHAVTVDRTYAASGSYGYTSSLNTISLSDGRAHRAARLEIEGGYNGIVARGDTVYMTTSPSSYYYPYGAEHTLDASDPRYHGSLVSIEVGDLASPRVVNRSGLGANAYWNIAALTDNALVLSGGYGSGLAVFDVSADRFAPTYRRYARTNGYSVSITQEGETLFLAGGPYGIQTVALTE
jgi:hypothetical protein